MAGKRSKGEGGITRRKDGLWAASVTLGRDGNGKQLRRWVYAKTRSEVARKLFALQQEVTKGLLVGTDMALKDWFDNWLDGVKTRTETNTWRRYEQHGEHRIKRHLGSVPLTKITPLMLVDFLAHLARNGESDDSRARTIACLKTCLDYAVDLGLLSHNPASKVAKPVPTRAEIRPLTPDELSRFYAYAKQTRYYPLYVTAIDTGAREGELFALTWPDVDLGNDPARISITKSLEESKGVLRVKDCKTPKSRRLVPVSAATKDILSSLYAERVHDGHASWPVFASKEGNYLRRTNFLSRHWHPLLRRAGLPSIRFHDLRHTCATLLLLSDVSPKVVAERFGHSKVDLVLNTYSHVLPGMQEAATNALAKFLPRQDVSQAVPGPHHVTSDAPPLDGIEVGQPT